MTYSYTDANGCDGEATFTIHVDGCLSVAENGQAFGLEAYPNPTSGKLMVSAASGVFSLVSITDIQGKAITCDSWNTSSQIIEVDFSGQVSGVYFIKALVDGQSIVLRVQKH